MASDSVVSKTLSNTILTDYLESAPGDDRIEKIGGFGVYPAQDSIAFMKMFTPYMIAAKSEETPVDMTRIDEALEKAKGYYELIGQENGAGQKIILRFNIRAFRNNYGLTDLTRMNLVFHGVEVGASTESSLNMEAELSVTAAERPRVQDLANTEHSSSSASPPNEKVSAQQMLKVYDVVLAGVIPAARTEVTSVER